MFKIIFNIVPFFFALGTAAVFNRIAAISSRAKSIWLAALLFCAAKFTGFFIFGGDSFAPELPEIAIWIWNWAYSGMCILFALSLVSLAICLPVEKIYRRRICGAAWLAAIAIVSWGAAGVGLWNGIRPPEITEIELSFDNLPDNLDGYRIVQISDVHASSAARRWRTEKIVTLANALNADLICLTGDLSDGMSASQTINVEPLGGLKAKDGVISISGNHEYYYDTPEWERFYRRLRLEPLENACVFPKAGLAVAGVPDPAVRRFRRTVPDPDTAFASATNGEFRILLQHRPFIDFEKESGRQMNAHVDLQLSGHTHGGVAPAMAEIVKMMNGGMVRGVYKLQDGRTVYVSTGAGQWAGFPMRFFDDPEIALITLRKSK